MAKIIKHFLNDEDGFSARDFLMVLFCGLYVVLTLVVFITSYFGIVNNMAFEVVQSLDNIVAIILGGTFTVQTAQSVGNTVIKWWERKNNVSIPSEIDVNNRIEEEMGVDPDSDKYRI